MQRPVTQNSKQDVWPVKAATVITSSQQNVTILLKEFLRNFHWTVANTTTSIQAALDQVHRGNASLIIIDDSPELPAPMVQRYLMCDPVASLTPTLVFVSSNNRTERAAMSNLGRPMLVDKPLTPNRFIPGLKTLIKVWSESIFLEVRYATEAIIKGNEETGLKMLTKLANEDKGRVLVAPALSFYFRTNGNIKIAEKVLLTALKTAPRNLGLILSLCDLYFHCAMPRTALRLLKSAETTYGNSLSIQPDKYQAEMMLQNLEGMTQIFNSLHARGYFPDEYRTFLARILYSEGQLTPFHKLVPNANKVAAFHDAWENTPEKTNNSAA